MPDDATTTLRAALEAATRREAAANQRATAAEGRVKTATVNQLAAQEQSFDSAIASATAAQSLSRQKWVALQEEGKFEEAGMALQEMQEASTAVQTLKAQRNYIANQREQAARAPDPSGDPLEGYSDAEKTWIREHPQYLSDPGYAAKINAAANSAEHLQGLTRGTQEWFEAINQVAHPERYAGGGGVDDQGAFSDTGDYSNSGGALEQRHTIDSPEIQATPEVPVMRTGQGERPENPQERAVGRGGGGITGTAAPPSRRIAEAGGRASRGAVTLSQEEYETAAYLAESIEPEVARQGQEKIAEWYYMMLHHPSNTNNSRQTGTRRARQGWSREAILA